MKYLKYIYLVYGIPGVLAGVMGFMASAQSTTDQFATGNPLFEEYTLFSRGFGNAILTIALISILTFFIKDYFSKKWLTLILAVFNSVAAYLCLSIDNIPTASMQAGYFHIFLALVLGVMGLFLIKKDNLN